MKDKVVCFQVLIINKMHVLWLQATSRNAKSIRKSGFALTERLKENSRSRHRGGVNELSTMGGTERLKSANKKVLPRISDLIRST